MSRCGSSSAAEASSGKAAGSDDDEVAVLAFSLSTLTQYVVISPLPLATILSSRRVSQRPLPAKINSVRGANKKGCCEQTQSFLFGYHLPATTYHQQFLESNGPDPSCHCSPCEQQCSHYRQTTGNEIFVHATRQQSPVHCAGQLSWSNLRYHPPMILTRMQQQC
jgi:hypothetical protein